MKNVILLLFMLLFIACGKEPQEIQRYTGIAEEFTEIIEEFDDLGYQELGNDYTNISFPVNFGDSGAFHGVCNTYNNGTREVIIDKAWWDKASKRTRRGLLFHEFGHCKLNKSHIDNRREYMNTPVNARVVRLNPDSIHNLFH